MFNIFGVRIHSFRQTPERTVVLHACQVIVMKVITIMLKLSSLIPGISAPLLVWNLRKLYSNHLLSTSTILNVQPCTIANDIAATTTVQVLLLVLFYMLWYEYQLQLHKTELNHSNNNLIVYIRSMSYRSSFKYIKAAARIYVQHFSVSCFYMFVN